MTHLLAYFLHVIIRMSERIESLITATYTALHRELVLEENLSYYRRIVLQMGYLCYEVK